jgi:hypothetical protein
LDPWDALNGQKAFFNADGIHFNDARAEKFSRLIDARLFKSLGNSFKQVEQGKPAMLRETAQKVVEKSPAQRDDSADQSGISGAPAVEQTHTTPSPLSTYNPQSEN